MKTLINTGAIMLDIKFIRENPDIVKNACQVKGFDDNTDKILELDARVRELKTITQSKTAEKNKITREIPTATDKAPLIAKSKEINAEIANDLAELSDKENQLNELLHCTPQIPSADAPIGRDDSDNVEVRRVGTPREFDFTPRPQWELLEMNNWYKPEKIASICANQKSPEEFRCACQVMIDNSGNLADTQKQIDEQLGR